MKEEKNCNPSTYYILRKLWCTKGVAGAIHSNETQIVRPNKFMCVSKIKCIYKCSDIPLFTWRQTKQHRFYVFNMHVFCSHFVFFPFIHTSLHHFRLAVFLTSTFIHWTTELLLTVLSGFCNRCEWVHFSWQNKIQSFIFSN